MSEVRVLTKYGPLYIEDVDGKMVMVRTKDQTHDTPAEPWMVNRVMVRIGASLQMDGSKFDYYNVRRADAYRNGKWDDTVSRSIHDKVRAEIIDQVKAASAAFPDDLVLSGRVHEYKRLKQKHTAVLREAEKSAQEARVELAKLEQSLTDDMRAFMVEEKLGE